jgi:hypothetical protein
MLERARGHDLRRCSTLGIEHLKLAFALPTLGRTLPRDRIA